MLGTISMCEIPLGQSSSEVEVCLKVDKALEIIGCCQELKRVENCFKKVGFLGIE
jgi:hypothetical protein